MSNNKFKVLIIEDEANICSFIQTLLETNGYQALVAQTCVMGMTMFISYNPDLVILDLGLPDRDGLDAIRSIRQKYLTPIIVLSARTTEQDKIEALDLGANDYITKPFSPSVLCAKVKACLRRMSLSAPSSSGVLSAGPFCYFSDEMRLLKKGIEVPLSSKESFLMKYFLTNQNKVLTKEQIYRSIWGDNVVDDNTIMVHIRRLRTKIEDDPNKPLYLRTIRGVGYQFVAE